MNDTRCQNYPLDEEVPVLHPAAPPRLASVRRPGRPKLQKERFTLTQSLELTAELLTMQLKLEVPTHSPNPRRRAAQARRRSREFTQITRDLRQRMEELCEAQAELEEVRGTAQEGEAIRVRDEAERRFRETFLLLAGQLPPAE